MNCIEENEMEAEVQMDREIAEDGCQSINTEIGKYTVELNSILGLFITCHDTVDENIMVDVRVANTEGVENTHTDIGINILHNYYVN